MYPPTRDTPALALALARAHLVHPRIQVAPSILPDWIARALSWSGVGLDHVEGERVVAVGNASIGDAFDEHFFLTDRRLAGRSGERRFDVPLGAVAHVEWRAGILDRALRVVADGVAHDAAVGPFVQPLGTLLEALARVPPIGRVPPAEPLCTTGETDPTGAAGARAALAAPDPRFELMLALAESAHLQGRLEAGAAADLVARIVLLHRTTYGGRGMRDGSWLSPLWVADLAGALRRVLGQPLRESADGEWHALDFQLRAGSAAAGAVASSAVGLLALATLGVGWVSVPGRTVRAVRVWLSDHPAPPRFRLIEPASGAPLSAAAPAAVRAILGALLERELALLVRRCVFGWGVAPEELAARSPATVAAGIQATLGAVDLRPVASLLG